MLRLVHAAASVTIIVIIAKLLRDCAWYNEKSEEEHCHLILDMHDKMEQAARRMEERMNAQRDEIQVQMDEIRAQLLLIRNGDL